MRKKPAVGQTAGKSAEKRVFLKSPEKFWVLPPVPAETMDSQGSLTYPKPGFTVTDSRGLAPHFPAAKKRQSGKSQQLRFDSYHLIRYPSFSRYACRRSSSVAASAREAMRCGSRRSALPLTMPAPTAQLRAETA